MAIMLSVGYADQVVSKNKKPTKPADVKATEQGTSKKAGKELKGLEDVGPKITPQEVSAKLAKGKTTLEETLAFVGEPLNISIRPDGGRMVIYQWRKVYQTPSPGAGGIVADSAMGLFLPGVQAGLRLGSISKVKRDAQATKEAIRAAHRSLTLIFDDKGVLKDSQFSPPLETTPSPLTASVETKP